MSGRKTFADILRATGFEVSQAYSDLHILMYRREFGHRVTLAGWIEFKFLEIPFTSPSATLRSFNARHGFDFEYTESTDSLDYYLNFCEYVYSFVKALIDMDEYPADFLYPVAEHIEIELDSIGYVPVALDDGLYIFVEGKPQVVEAALVAPPSASKQIMKYGHRSMEGDLESKRHVLLELADQIEARKDDLSSLSPKLKDNLFFALNNLHVRHNNVTPGTSYFKEPVAELSPEEMELWYDRIYTMSLEALLALERSSFLKEIAKMKREVSGGR